MLMTRVRAPELRGRGWLNTGGKSLSIKDFRGRVLIMDFWTFCCINCLHVLDELRPLEEKYGDVLDIVGVHSPKFEHERDPEALAAAVQRYGVAHPVLDDPDLITWDQYAAKAWPTLSVVDPEGYVVASMAGEGHAEGLARLVEELVATHTERGTIRRGDGAYVPAPDPGTTLRFPGKAIVGPAGTLVAVDSAHHSLVELDLSALDQPVRRIGSGQRGRGDGPAATAGFSEPNGLCLLPPDVAALVGYDLVVADTVNHLLRGVDLATGDVSTVAGTGRQWRGSVDFDPHPAVELDLSSPWDVAWYQGRVIVAMAGIHQLWCFDPAAGTAGVYAGTTVEALRDGALDQVWMAQPSGLSVSPDGATLWIADSESSALRFVRDGEMHTAVGQGLFDFGHMDGPAEHALFQHPLGVCALSDGSVLVADTYNGAVRRYDPDTQTVSTVATGLAEPSDIVALPDGGLMVVESAAHRIVPLDPTDSDVSEKAIAPNGHRLCWPRARWRSASSSRRRRDRSWTSRSGRRHGCRFRRRRRNYLCRVRARRPDLNRTLVISSSVDGGVLQVVAQAATCDVEADHPACHLTRQDWGVPIVVSPTGAIRLPLILRGLDAPQDT